MTAEGREEWMEQDKWQPVYSTVRLLVICKCTALLESGLLCQEGHLNPEFMLRGRYCAQRVNILCRDA
jgi:hypothetical protein